MGWFRKKKSRPSLGKYPAQLHLLPAQQRAKRGSGSALRQKPQGDACKKYQYDPLQREPQVAPTLRTSQYRPEDFQL